MAPFRAPGSRKLYFSPVNSREVHNVDGIMYDLTYITKLSLFQWNFIKSATVRGKIKQLPDRKLEVDASSLCCRVQWRAVKIFLAAVPLTGDNKNRHFQPLIIRSCITGWISTAVLTVLQSQQHPCYTQTDYCNINVIRLTICWTLHTSQCRGLHWEARHWDWDIEVPPPQLISSFL